jgi:hypothetical protein
VRSEREENVLDGQREGRREGCFSSALRVRTESSLKAMRSTDRDRSDDADALRWDGDAMPRNKMAIEEKRGEEMAVEDTPEREKAAKADES